MRSAEGCLAAVSCRKYAALTCDKRRAIEERGRHQSDPEQQPDWRRRPAHPATWNGPAAAPLHCTILHGSLTAQYTWAQLSHEANNTWTQLSHEPNNTWTQLSYEANNTWTQLSHEPNYHMKPTTHEPNYHMTPITHETNIIWTQLSHKPNNTWTQLLHEP